MICAMWKTQMDSRNSEWNLKNGIYHIILNVMEISKFGMDESNKSTWAGNICDVKSKWEKDLECLFTDDEWKTICEEAQSFSINSHHKFIQFNVMHRIYYTTVRLHSFKSSYLELCRRCKADRGTLLHMPWNNIGKRSWRA